MSEVMLQVSGLSGGYGTTQVFEGVDLTVKAGESIGIFGPNGHGKSSFLRTLSGLMDPWEGDIFFEGKQLNTPGVRGSRRWKNFNYDAITRRRMNPMAIAKAGLIHVSQGNLLFPDLTVAETLSIAATAASNRKGWKLADVETLFPRIKERRSHKIRFLSGGERQMVSVSAGLMSAPKLLILDEPTLGLSPKIREELCQAVLSVRNSGLPLILIDQDVTFLKKIIDTLYIFDHGRITAQMNRANMPSHEALMEMLFGENK